MDPYHFYSTQEELLMHSDLHLWALSPDPSDHLAAAVSEPLPLPPQPAPRRSAFSHYTRPPAVEAANSSPQPRGGQNIHRRAVELLRCIHRGKQDGRCGGSGGEGSSGFRHMMRERQRRERLSQSYADLHAVLSPRTKADKNSIVQTAATLVRELKELKEGLQKQNEELMNRMRIASTSAAAAAERTSAGNCEKLGGEGKIKVQALIPESAIDSLISALRCLEGMDVKARAVRSEFSGGCGDMTAVMDIETNKGGGELEVQGMMEKMLAVEGWRYLK